MTKFQPLKCRFPYKLCLQRDPKFNIVATILNSIQKPDCIFVISFHPTYLFKMVSDKPFNYHSGLWLLLSSIILSQTFSKLQK